MAEHRKAQPRFSQFALASARDTSAFETRTGPATNEGAPAEAPPPASDKIRTEESGSGAASATGEVATSAEPAHVARPPAKARPSPAEDDELVSFTVRLPASLYMRMRRSLGLREKLGELCVAAITKELDSRR